MRPFRDIISVSGKEWGHVAAASVAAVVMTSISAATAVIIGIRDDTVWTGMTALAPGDISVYLSYLGQANRGTFLIENLFTIESLHPVFSVFWSLVGCFSRFFYLPPLVAFHFSRVMLIPVLMSVAYAFFAYVLPKVGHRITALYVFAFSSGMGLFFKDMFSQFGLSSAYSDSPIDLWVAESNTFLSMLYSPHFIASLVGVLLTILFLMAAFEAGSTRYTLYAGLSGLILFQFHPFYVVSLYPVAAAFAVAQSFRNRGSAVRNFLNLALFAAVSVPSVAYHYFLTHYDANAAALRDANLTLTPALWYVVAGFGLVGVLWLYGYACGRRGHPNVIRWDFLFIWAAVQFMIIYAPVPFQRRLLEGLQFPLVALSAPILFMWYTGLKKGLRGRHQFRYVVACFALVAAFFLSTMNIITTNIVLYDSDKEKGFFYYSLSEAEAIDWLGSNADNESVILSSFSSGNRIVGRIARRVYAGHWVTTIRLGEKRSQIARFFGSADEEFRKGLLKEAGVTHVFYGPLEKEFLGVRSEALTETGYLTQAFIAEDFEIFIVETDGL